MKKDLPWLTAAAVVTLAAPATMTSQARPSPFSQDKIAIAGKWRGIYQVYPNYIQMTLTIPDEPSPDGQTSAELRIEGLGGRNASQMGVVKAVVQYQPDVRVLEITAAGASSVPSQRFHAVYDADRHVFAGYRPEGSADASPYFFLSRDGDNGKLFDKIGDMPNGGGGGRRLGFSLNLGSSPSEEDLGKWAGQMLTEYPDLDPYRTELGSVYRMAANLFRDEYFKPYFGKTFDEMSERDMGKVYDRIQHIPPPRANFPEERGRGAAKAMQRGFWVNTGTGSASEVMLTVLAMRSIAAWKTQTLKSVEKIAAVSGAFDALAAIEGEEQGTLSLFWPSERQAFLDAVSAQRTRIAGPVLAANVEQQLSSASRFTDVAGLQQVLNALVRPPSASSSPRASTPSRRGMTGPRAAVREDIPTLASFAADNVRSTLASEVRSKISTIVNDEARADTYGDDLAPPATLAGLEQSGARYQRAQSKYGSFLNEQAVQALLAGVAAQRATILRAARPELEAAIDRSASEQAVNATLARYLNVPSDQADVVGARLIARGDSVKRELRNVQAAAVAVQQARASARQSILDGRSQDVAERRRALNAQLNSRLPTFDDLASFLQVVPTITERNTEDEVDRFLAAARSIGFSLANRNGTIYSDENVFANKLGDLSTGRYQNSKTGSMDYIVSLVIPGATRQLAELYAQELRAGYREMSKSSFDTVDSPVEVVASSPLYIKSGAMIYEYGYSHDSLSLTVMVNNGDANVMADRLDRDLVEVNSYSRSTDIVVLRGEELHLTATGSVVLGPFVGSSGPGGISGFDNYRKNARFPLGSLIGQIGDGEWFLVGTDQTTVAAASGILKLRINDSDPDNNNGSFRVRYSKSGGRSPR